MKFYPVLVLALLFSTTAPAQHINPADHKLLKQKEDSLKIQSRKLVMGINPADRFNADSNFTRILVRSLKIRNSFYYRFDSLSTISKLYAPDSSFRIFTWQMVINDNVIRQHGAIQMRTEDGSLKLFPLIDKSDVTIANEDTVGNNNGWIGAVYYKIILTKHSGRNYYTLLGYDENNIRSNKKLIEVLRFENGQPIFGGPFFSIPNGSLVPKNPARYIIEYKKESAVKMNYDDEMGIILAEHLISETKEPQKKWTYVTNGDFEGFKWVNGKWVFLENVRNYKTRDPKTPLDKTIFDDKGTIDESKLKGNEMDSIPGPVKKTDD